MEFFERRIEKSEESNSTIFGPKQIQFIRIQNKKDEEEDEPTEWRKLSTFVYYMDIDMFKIKNLKELFFIIVAVSIMITLVLLISLVGKNLTYTTRFTPPST